MTLSTFERLLIIVTLFSVAYRHVTNEWPITVEVEE